MKELLKKSILPTSSAIAGILIAVIAFKLSPSLRSKIENDHEIKSRDQQIYDDIFKKQEDIRHQFDSLLNDDLVAKNDPFEEMKKIRKQMEKSMGVFEGKGQSLSNPFDSWFSDKFGGGTINDISKREDDGFVYYDIQVDDLKSTSISTKVEKGYVTVIGTLEKKEGSNEKEKGYADQRIYKSSFNRTFPLPSNVEESKMQMLTEKDKIILKFPKIKA